MELNKIKGIGPKTLSLLNKLNIDDIDDQEDATRCFPKFFMFICKQ